MTSLPIFCYFSEVLNLGAYEAVAVTTLVRSRFLRPYFRAWVSGVAKRLLSLFGVSLSHSPADQYAHIDTNPLRRS